jgi:hypothetical protein
MRILETEFYLISEDDLQKRYKKHRTRVLMEELLMICLIDRMKYKEVKVMRQKMLNWSACFLLRKRFQWNKISLTILIWVLKINFLNFIEVNYGNPVDQLEPHKRIEAIKKTLIIYTNENIQKQTIMIKRLKRSTRLIIKQLKVIKSVEDRKHFCNGSNHGSSGEAKSVTFRLMSKCFWSRIR